MADTRHQCRYCSYCVFTLDGDWWCEELDKYCESPKRPNTCKTWLFNEIAADNPNKVFKPRPKRTGLQQLKFAFMERKVSHG